MDSQARPSNFHERSRWRDEPRESALEIDPEITFGDRYTFRHDVSLRIVLIVSFGKQWDQVLQHGVQWFPDSSFYFVMGRRDRDDVQFGKG